MPEYHQVETVRNFTQDQVLLLSFASFQKLGWLPVLAEADKIFASTTGSTYSRGQSVHVEVAPSTLIVKSQMVNNEKWDLMKRNRKNVEKFLEAFNAASEEANDENFQVWEQGLMQLQQQTIFLYEQQNKEAEELDRVMNLSSGSMTATYVIMALNIIVFCWMVFSGVNIFQPEVDDLVKWGGNYKPLTTGGEWWRLFTAVFVHVGIIHLALNMYAFYMVGMYLEPMLGKIKFVAAYITTGILASLISIWWNQNSIISAGASGAIFGMYGVFLALLSTSLIPAATRKALLTSIGIFVFYNLVYGASSKTIDNAAHLGGLFSGLIVGYLFLPVIKNPSLKRSAGISIAVLIMAVAASGFYIYKAGDDALAYEKQIEKILQLQSEALGAVETGNDEEVLNKLNTYSIPKWKEARQLIITTNQYKISGSLAKHRELMTRYIDLRIEQSGLIVAFLRGDKTMESKIQELTIKINAVVAEMESGKT
jgi:rhomboid protease GluP